MKLTSLFYRSVCPTDLLNDNIIIIIIIVIVIISVYSLSLQIWFLITSSLSV